MLIAVLFLIPNLSILISGERYTQTDRFEPAEIPTDATRVEFREYEINTLPANLFLNFTKCRYLKFYNMGISQIESGAWNGLQNLEELLVKYNKLTVLYARMFANLDLLFYLDLQRNKISSIDPRAFNGLTMLTKLFLGSNLITSIPETTFRGLQSVRHLVFSNNQIIFISEATFNGLESLNSLWLENNPINITSLQSLRQINETLKTLYLGSTHINYIPEGAFQFFGTLHFLSLSSNNIKFLPPKAFTGASSLDYLDISSNDLKTLQRNIFDSGDFTSTGGHPGISFSLPTEMCQICFAVIPFDSYLF